MILVTGNYDSRYPRNGALLKMLEKKYGVVELNRRTVVFFDFLREFRRKITQCEAILVLQPIHQALWLLVGIRLITRKKIILDAFTSTYDTYVNDRKLVGRFSLKAAYYFLSDWVSVHLSDSLIFDTVDDKNYFYEKFYISEKKKSAVIPVCVDMILIDSIKEKKVLTPQTVLFYGNYIPLQGISFIVEAAKLLQTENIHFIMIGSGQTYVEIQTLVSDLKVTNITFIPKISYTELISYITSVDVCLGIFGTSDKAARVIPNKVLESMACGKVVITGKTPAMEKYFRHGQDVIYCERGDASDLARSIRETLAHEPGINEKIGENARSIIKSKFSLESDISLP